MKHRIKWMLVGLGFTFGMQSIIALLANLLFFSGTPTASPPAVAVALILGLLLGAFLVGGFIISLMNEEFRLLDASIVTLLTLMLSALIFLFSAGETSKVYLTTSWLSDASGHFSITAGSFIYVALALFAASAGTYVGYRIKVPQEGQLDRLAALAGLVGAVVGPFVLFSISGDDPANANDQGFPWYFLVIVILVVLVFMGIGFLMFTRESHEAEELSISPPKDELATGEK